MVFYDTTRDTFGVRLGEEAHTDGALGGEITWGARDMVVISLNEIQLEPVGENNQTGT